MAGGVKFISSQPDDRENDENEDEDDVLDTSRVRSAKQAKLLKQAVASNPDAFVSFSEGMATVDKFELIYDSMVSAHALPSCSQEFVSFSQGMANVEKFELVHSPGFIHNIGNISSFAQAAEVLAQLSQLSETLCKLLSSVKGYPFLNQVTVEWKQAPSCKEFCPSQILLQLDSNVGIEETLLDLCHQLYHLAYPNKERLYGSGQLSLDQFTDTMFWSEIAALLCETTLRQELGFFDSAPVQIYIKDAKNAKNSYWIDLDHFLAERDLGALREILSKSTVRGSVSLTLSDWVARAYESYITTFNERSQLVQLQN